MDGLQHQVNTLNQKVEQLHQIVERLSGQLTVIASPNANATSSLIPSDQPLQPLPKLSHREEKPAYAHAHLVGSQDNRELVGNINSHHHRDNSYVDESELVGNSHHHGKNQADNTELVGNHYHRDKNYGDSTELVGNHHNGNSSTYTSSHALDSQKGYYRASMEHKDVLIEDEMPQTIIPDPLHEASVASDIQIRRLMAQLTAAYNRIAILEEQLIACRMK